MRMNWIQVVYLIAIKPPMAEYAMVITVLMIKQVDALQPVIVVSILPMATSWLARKPKFARKQQIITISLETRSYRLMIRPG